MQISLLHSTNTRDSLFYGHDDIYSAEDALQALDTGHYEFVGVLEVDDLEDAFIRTQSLDYNWTLDATSHDFLSGHASVHGARSTSVGDIIFGEDDEIYIVAPDGFDRIGRVTLKRMEATVGRHGMSHYLRANQ